MHAQIGRFRTLMARYPVFLHTNTRLPAGKLLRFLSYSWLARGASGQQDQATCSSPRFCQGSPSCDATRGTRHQQWGDVGDLRRIVP
jgi:hypothetical protein